MAGGAKRWDVSFDNSPIVTVLLNSLHRGTMERCFWTKKPAISKDLRRQLQFSSSCKQVKFRDTGTVEDFVRTHRAEHVLACDSNAPEPPRPSKDALEKMAADMERMRHEYWSNRK